MAARGLAAQVRLEIIGEVVAKRGPGASLQAVGAVLASIGVSGP